MSDLDEIKRCPWCTTEPPPRPITKEEEAVIEAAVNVVKRYELTGQCTSKTAEGERLVNAVRALTAPKAVRPSEVEPGTRFRFFVDSPESQTRIVLANVNGVRMYLNPVTFHAYYFTESERIIPIQEED